MMIEELQPIEQHELPLPLTQSNDMPLLLRHHEKRVNDRLLGQIYIFKLPPAEPEPEPEVEKPAQNWDPILISLLRRAMPNLIAYDVCGVQPMSGPTGLIFAMRNKYDKEIKLNILESKEAPYVEQAPIKNDNDRMQDLKKKWKKVLDGFTTGRSN